MAGSKSRSDSPRTYSQSELSDHNLTRLIRVTALELPKPADERFVEVSKLKRHKDQSKGEARKNPFLSTAPYPDSSAKKHATSSNLSPYLSSTSKFTTKVNGQASYFDQGKRQVLIFNSAESIPNKHNSTEQEHLQTDGIRHNQLAGRLTVDSKKRPTYTDFSVMRKDGAENMLVPPNVHRDQDAIMRFRAEANTTYSPPERRSKPSSFSAASATSLVAPSQKNISSSSLPAVSTRATKTSASSSYTLQFQAREPRKGTDVLAASASTSLTPHGRSMPNSSALSISQQRRNALSSATSTSPSLVPQPRRPSASSTSQLRSSHIFSAPTHAASVVPQGQPKPPTVGHERALDRRGQIAENPKTFSQLRFTTNN
jgi:hypothetical protein